MSSRATVGFWEGLLTVILVITHCNGLTVTMLRMYIAAAVLSTLIKVITNSCHARGHINVMLVLQSCTDSLRILPGSSVESRATSSDGACNFSNEKVEEDIFVKEESFIAIKEEVDIGIKKEEIPEDINFPNIKCETNEVSYVCLSVIRHILLVSSNVSYFCDVSISGQF